jgi:predicted kinase
MNDAGYRVAYAIAEDNLKIGKTVVADGVNPIHLSRDAWHEVAQNAASPSIDIEVICSDQETHKKRVESRTIDKTGLRQPTWNDVLKRQYEPWTTDRLIVDTAHQNLDQAIDVILNFLRTAK